MTLGVDVSHWQPIDLPWAAWVADGLSVAVIQTQHGFDPEPHADEHLAGAVAAGVPYIGAYHFLKLGNDGWEQARDFVASLKPEHTFCAVDVEETGSSTHLGAFCQGYKDNEKQGRPLYLYGNYSELVAYLNTRPELKKYPVWWPQYAHAMTPPADLHVVGWQKLGSEPGFIGHLPPYPDPIDITEWFELPSGEKPMPVPIVATGPKLGIHSINPGNTLALVQRAVDSGWHWPMVKVCNDAQVCVGVKAISPDTLTYCRYVTDDADQNLQGVESWTLAQMQAWAARRMALLTGRTTAAQFAATDYWGLTNEPDPPGVAGHRALGLALIELVKLATARGVKLALPAYPQGVPEYDEMVALTDTGVGAYVKAGGHIWDEHEGVFTDQPIDFGYNDTIPGARTVPGAGSTNFRHRYLYSLLDARGELVPLVVSEFYGGGRYADPPASQLERFKWYDTRARAEPYLLAFLPFTINPNDGWKGADYGPTFSSRELWDYIAAEKDLPNGVEEMPILKAEKQALHDGAAALLARIDAIVTDDPPAPAQPLYMATVLIGVVIRDTAGADTGRRLTAGTQVAVYAEHVTAGGYTERVRINQNGDNVTTQDNTGRPTLVKA